MNLIRAFIQNPVKVAVAMVLLILFGGIAGFNMPMQLTPEVYIPTISVSTRWPGASPQEIEREIVQEQEEQLKSVEGLTKLSSECQDSAGNITLEFLVGTDMDEALLKVNSRLQQVSEYPEDADEPVITTSNVSDQAIAYFILSPPMLGEGVLNEFESTYPKTVEALKPIRNSHNEGLAVLRLRNLLNERGDEFPELVELLPENRAADLPDAGDIESYAAQYQELKSEVYPGRTIGLQDVLDTELIGRRYVFLTKLTTDHSELEPLKPTAMKIDTLRKFAEDTIESRFERVSGVSNSNVMGGRDPEMQVIVDPQKLAARGLTILDVRRVLRNQNKDTSGGDFWDQKRRYIVRTLGQFRDVEQVKRQVITSTGNSRVYVGDVAEVRLSYKKPDAFVRRFGGEAIVVNAYRETGANVLDVMKGLKAAVKELNSGALAQRRLKLTQVSDQTEYIYSSIGLVFSNIIVGGLLTVVVLLVFLRSGRSTLIIFLAIPSCIVGTMLVLAILGRSLNVISLAGMAFAVGMLVDNAVVVLENIYRHHQLGTKSFAASERATKEVWGAIIASTLTTLAVFVPVVFIQEEAGQLFRDISLAISAAVALSLLVSVMVIPTASARLLRNRSHERSTPRFNVMAPVDWFARGFVNILERFTRTVQKSWLLRLTVVIVLVGSSGWLTWYLWPKVEYLPTGNRNLVFGIVRPPPGYNLEKMRSMGSEIEAYLRPNWDIDLDDPELEGKPLIRDFFYVARGRSLFFGARSVDPLRSGQLVPLINSVRAQLPGTMVFANKASLFGRGLSAGRTIDIEITGPDIRRLVEIGRGMMGQVAQHVYHDVNGNGERDPDEPTSRAQPIPSVDLNSPEIHIEPRNVQSRDLGFSNSDVGYIVNAIVDGAYASDYYVGGEKIDMSILATSGYDGSQDQLRSIPIATPEGQLVPLTSIANIELSSGPEQINHRERQRAITIQVTPPNELPLEDAIEIVRTKIVEPTRNSPGMSSEYNILLSGTADKLRQTWDALKWNVLLALLITYLLMAALFESWLYPFVIILSVPLGAVGGVLGLHLLGIYLSFWGEPPQQLDVLTMLGFVILIGTVVNNAILIVHQSLNYMRNEQLDPSDAITRSVRTRIRPIFMTTATTVFGLAPLVFFPGAGSELYRGLGSVVLGGLVVSTLFTLVLVPTLFSMMMDLFGSRVLRQSNEFDEA